jgi:hypothetical protein
MEKTESSKKRGRPQLPNGEAKTRYVPVRFSEKELATFTKAAEKSPHKTLSAWIRHMLSEAVKKGK